MEEAIYFKEEAAILFIKPMGHVTASLCTDLKQMVFKRLDGQPPVKEIIVDLSICEYMDSTFMGLLVGFHKKLMNIAHKSLAIYNPNETCQKLFTSLGIHKMLKTIYSNLKLPRNMKTIVKTATLPAELLLKAHEDLMDLSEANRVKFAILRSVLQNQIKKEKGGV